MTRKGLIGQGRQRRLELVHEEVQVIARGGLARDLVGVTSEMR